MKKNFLITTGGSGGHVVPATILYDHLKSERNIIITTDKRGLKYLDKNNYKIELINTPKFNNIFLLPFNLIKVLFLFMKSFFLLKFQNVEKVFSTGGYMSLPLLFAAKILRLDIYLIEPNQVLGRSNKFFLSSCKKIFCYSDQIKNYPLKLKNKIVVINPLVRKKIYELKASKKKDKFSLLIVGGSQGANIFDQKLKDVIINVSKITSIKIVQQTAQKNISNLSDLYNKNNIENKIFNFDENFTSTINEIDLCITRAGASTLAELSFLNIPFITVPLPSSKDNHQLENAIFYENNDCCWVIKQNDFEEKIEELLKYILDERSDYLKKKENLKRLNYQNTWINVNQKILEIINEN